MIKITLDYYVFVFVISADNREKQGEERKHEVKTLEGVRLIRDQIQIITVRKKNSGLCGTHQSFLSKIHFFQNSLF